MTITIIISIYVVLVLIAYGMLLQKDQEGKLNFAIAALIIWAIVPFVILIIFGRWMWSLSGKLNNE